MFNLDSCDLDTWPLLAAVMCEWQVSGFSGRYHCRSLYLFGLLNQHTVVRTAGVRQDGVVLGGVNRSGGGGR